MHYELNLNLKLVPEIDVQYLNPDNRNLQSILIKQVLILLV